MRKNKFLSRGLTMMWAADVKPSDKSDDQDTNDNNQNTNVGE